MALKDFVLSSDWGDIKFLFFEEMEKLKKDINTDCSMRRIGQEYVARQKAIKIIEDCLSRIERLGKQTDEPPKKISFR
jgi:hypothetical protein